MTDKGKGQIVNYHHITLWVGNAKQAAVYYCNCLGFKPYAYKGLETGSRDVVCHVVRQNDITIEFQSPLNANNVEMGEHLQKHGDGVRDIAFTVEGIEAIVSNAKNNGVEVVNDIYEVKDGTNGPIRMATIKTYGDTTHTFIECTKYIGFYLPQYDVSKLRIITTLPEVDLILIDHFAGNHIEGTFNIWRNWYEKCLSFTKYMSFSEEEVKSEFSSLRIEVYNNFNDKIVSVNSEPVPGVRKSQIQEFIDSYGGPGVQHFAFRSHDIIKDLRALRARGMDFMQTPRSYYLSLRERLKKSKVKVVEDLNAIEELNILVDFDDSGYLLQIFTQPVQDRPTLFLEIIQRHNNKGFGARNIKALFEAMEAEQKLRGNI